MDLDTKLQGLLATVNELDTEIESTLEMDERVLNREDVSEDQKKVLEKFYPILDEENYSNFRSNVKNNRNNIEQFDFSPEDIVRIYCLEKCYESKKDLVKAVEIVRELIVGVKTSYKEIEEGEDINMQGLIENARRNVGEMNEGVAEIEELNKDCYYRLEKARNAANEFNIQKWAEFATDLEKRVEQVEETTERLESELSNIGLELREL